MAVVGGRTYSRLGISFPKCDDGPYQDFDGRAEVENEIGQIQVQQRVRSLGVDVVLDYIDPILNRYVQDTNTEHR